MILAPSIELLKRDKMGWGGEKWAFRRLLNETDKLAPLRAACAGPFCGPGSKKGEAAAKVACAACLGDAPVALSAQDRLAFLP